VGGWGDGTLIDFLSVRIKPRSLHSAARAQKASEEKAGRYGRDDSFFSFGRWWCWSWS